MSQLLNMIVPDSMADADLDTLLAEAGSAKAAGRLSEGLAAAERAWAFATGALGDTGDDAARRREAGTLLAHFRYRTGALSAMVEVALEVLPLLRSHDHHRGELIDLLRMVSIGAGDTARFDLALDCAQEAHRVAIELGDLARQSLSLNALACFFERIGNPWQAERLMFEALELARESSAAEGGYARYVALNNLCGVAIGAFYLLRDGTTADEAAAVLERALPHAREAMAMAETTGEPFHRLMVRGNVAEMLVHLGQLDEAEALLADARSRAMAAGFGAQVWRMGVSLGELALRRGDAARARAVLLKTLEDSAASDPGTTQLRAHHGLARACEALGEVAQALEHHKRSQRLERERSLSQLRWQSMLFVTRVEAEQLRLQLQRAAPRRTAAEPDARIDALTGLATRRDVELRWPALVQRLTLPAVRKAALALLVVEVEGFDTLLARHGHAAADAVLITLARLLRESTRDGDLPARLPGAVFLAVLPGAETARALEVADRLRRRVARYEWRHIASPAAWPATSAPAAPTLRIGIAHAPPLELAALLERVRFA